MRRCPYVLPLQTSKASLGASKASQGPAPIISLLMSQPRAAQYDWARLELGGLHSSWSVVVLLGMYYAVVGSALVALDTAALGLRTGSGASAPLRALLASARARSAMMVRVLGLRNAEPDLVT